MEDTKLATLTTESAQADPRPKTDSNKPAVFITLRAQELGVTPATSDSELAELFLRNPGRNVKLTYIAGKGWRHKFTSPESDWLIIDLIAEVSGYENDRPRTIEKIAREISLAQQKKIASVVWRIDDVTPDEGITIWLENLSDPAAESELEYLISVPDSIMLAQNCADVCDRASLLLDFDEPTYANTLPPHEAEIWNENLSNRHGTAHLQQLRKMAVEHQPRLPRSLSFVPQMLDIDHLAFVYYKLLVGLRVQIVEGKLIAAPDETAST